MKDETLKNVDKTVDATSLVLLNEATAAREQSPLIVLEVDPNWIKLEAFAIGFLCGICQANNLPKEDSIFRFVSYVRFLREHRRGDPVVALDRALNCEFNPSYLPYFERGKQKSARILLGDYNAGLYVETLREESRSSNRQ